MSDLSVMEQLAYMCLTVWAVIAWVAMGVEAGRRNWRDAFFAFLTGCGFCALSFGYLWLVVSS